MFDILGQGGFWLGLFLGALITGIVFDRTLKANAKKGKLMNDDNARAMTYAKNQIDKLEEQVYDLKEENHKLKKRVK